MFDLQAAALSKKAFFEKYNHFFSNEFSRTLQQELIFPEEQFTRQETSRKLVLSEADVKNLMFIFEVINAVKTVKEAQFRLESKVQLIVLLGQQESHLTNYIAAENSVEPSYNKEKFNAEVVNESERKGFMALLMTAFRSAKEGKDLFANLHREYDPWITLLLTALAENNGTISVDLYNRETDQFSRTETKKLRDFILNEMIPSHNMINLQHKISGFRALAIDVILSKFFLSSQISSCQETAIFLEQMSVNLWREKELISRTRRCYKPDIGENYSSKTWRRFYAIREKLLERITSSFPGAIPEEEAEVEQLIGNMILLEGRLAGSFDHDCLIDNPNVQVFTDFLTLTGVDNPLKEKIWITCATYLPRLFADFIIIKNKASKAEDKFSAFLTRVLGNHEITEERFKQEISQRLYITLRDDNLPFTAFNPRFFWLHCGENYSFPKLCGLVYKDEILEKFTEDYEAASQQDKQALSAAATQRDDQGNPTHPLAQAFDVGVSLHNRGEYQKGKGDTCANKLEAILHPENVSSFSRLMTGAKTLFSRASSPEGDKELKTVKGESSGYFGFDGSRTLPDPRD